MKCECRVVAAGLLHLHWCIPNPSGKCFPYRSLDPLDRRLICACSMQVLLHQNRPVPIHQVVPPTATSSTISAVPSPSKQPPPHHPARRAPPPLPPPRPVPLPRPTPLPDLQAPLHRLSGSWTQTKATAPSQCATPLELIPGEEVQPTATMVHSLASTVEESGVQLRVWINAR